MEIKIVKREIVWKGLTDYTNDIYVNGKLHVSAVGNRALPDAVKNITEHLYINGWINCN